MDKQPVWPVVVALGALAVVGAGGGLYFWRHGGGGTAAKPAATGGPVTPVNLRLAPHRGSCPEGMVFVPAGTFTMGSPDAEGKPDEHPAHQVKLGGYCIGGTEVTVASYRECVENPHDDLQCKPPRAGSGCNWANPARTHHPVNCVDWEQAVTYCKWAGGSLPTEAQWEYAARGADGRRFPWGNEPPVATRLNACGPECAADYPNRKALYDKSDRYAETSPVGAFPDGAGPFGALDMAGNVFEWVSDWYAPYTAAPAENPTGPAAAGDKPVHVLRGGAFFTFDAGQLRTTSRAPAIGNGTSSAGFRCVHPS